MYFRKQYEFSVYILTNHEKTVLYVGMTNNLPDRLAEHYFNRGQRKTFAGRYYCYNLVYYDQFQYVRDAIAREKELKGWIREKKISLINSTNPSWIFLNKKVCTHWPPKEKPKRFYDGRT
jgi:putative endonuclease